MLTPLTTVHEYHIAKAVLQSDNLNQELSTLINAATSVARMFKTTLQIETLFPCVKVHDSLVIPDDMITMAQAYRFRFIDEAGQCINDTAWFHLPSGYAIEASTVNQIEEFVNHVLVVVFGVGPIVFPDHSVEDQTLTEAQIGLLRKVFDEAGFTEESAIDYDTAHEIYKKHQDGAPEGDWLDDLVIGLQNIEKEMDSLESGFHIRLYTSRTRNFRLAKEGIARKSLLTLKKKPLCISFYVKDKRVGHVEGVNYLYLSDRPKKAVSDLLTFIRNEAFDVFQRLHD